MQRTKITRRHCNTCGKETKFEKHIAARGAGDIILGFFTLGLWYVGRSLCDPRFRCSECGGR